jgi:hypothetical protein
MSASPGSREGLYAFLDYVIDKGLLNKATTAASKSTAIKVLSILDENEASDIINVDMEVIFNRFVNLEGSSYHPDSLRTYKSRLASAIDYYRSWLQNPAGFKVGSKGANSGSKPKTAKGEKPPVNKGNGASQTVSYANSSPSEIFVQRTVLPIPIRADVLVQVSGLPYDLTEREAAKIANVIRAMAMVD